MPSKPTVRQRREALLAAAQEAQEAFWTALYELEVELKLDIRSTDHLAGMTIEDLREKYK